MTRMTRSQVVEMARGARGVYQWAMQNGLKKPAQIEQMANGMAMDLTAAGIEIVDDSNPGGEST